MKRARPAATYAGHLERTTIEIGGSPMLLRAITPDDMHAYVRFISRTDPSDIRLRFFRGQTNAPTPEDLAHQTHVDYGRDIAFVAIEQSGPDACEIAGEVRAFRYPQSRTAEISMLVRSDMQKRGLGRALLETMIEYARATGIQELIGQMLPDNQAMIALARRCGMQVEHVESAGIVVAHMDLQAEP